MDDYVGTLGTYFVLTNTSYVVRIQCTSYIVQALLRTHQYGMNIAYPVFQVSLTFIVQGVKCGPGHPFSNPRELDMENG